MEGLEFFEKMNVCWKIKRKDAFASESKLISTTWVDTNKGTTECPNIMQACGKRNEKKQEVRILHSNSLEVAPTRLADDANSQNSRTPKRVGIVDIRRSYSNAKATRKIHAEIPRECWQRGDEDYVAALDMTLCGTLDAVQNWFLEVWHFLRLIGCRKGTASRSNFRHVDREINATVHGDDFFVTADSENLWWMMKKVHKKFEATTCVLGPENGMVREATFLIRKLRWFAEGIQARFHHHGGDGHGELEGRLNTDVPR